MLNHQSCIQQITHQKTLTLNLNPKRYTLLFTYLIVKLLSPSTHQGEENQRLSACHSAKPITSSRFHMHYQRKKAKWCFGELCPATHNCMRCLTRSSIVCACECHMMQFLTKLVLQENTTAGINISLAGCLSVCPSVRPQARQGNPETQQLNSQPHDNISPWGIRQCWPVIHFSDHLFT
jgi:hypothetical protein